MSGSYDRYLEGPRRSSFELIFGPFKALLKWLIWLTGIFFFIGVLLFFVTAGGNAQQTGVLNVVYARTDVALSQVPLVNIAYTGAKDLLKFRQDPSLLIRDYGWKTNVDNNKENQNLGLRFVTSFIPSKQNYLVDEEIIASSTVEISSLKEDSIVEFSCSSKDLTQDKQIMVQPTEPQKIFKNQLKRFEVACKVPSNSFEIPEGKEVYPAVIKIQADYDFKTNSYLDVYTMQKSYLDQLVNQGKNPFETINNPSLDKQTGQTKPTTTKGPMYVILRLQYSQPLTEFGPFSEDNTYSLGLKIEKSSSEWEGKLNKINQIYLNLPSSFELVDDNFEEVNIDNEEQEINSFRRYRLKQEFIDKLNSQCEIYKLDTEKCDVLNEKGFIITITKFKVNDVEPRLVNDFIGAEVEYKFETQRRTSVTLVKSFV